MKYLLRKKICEVRENGWCSVKKNENGCCCTMRHGLQNTAIFGADGELNCIQDAAENNYYFYTQTPDGKGVARQAEYSFGKSNKIYSDLLSQEVRLENLKSKFIGASKEDAEKIIAQIATAVAKIKALSAKFAAADVEDKAAADEHAEAEKARYDGQRQEQVNALKKVQSELQSAPAEYKKRVASALQSFAELGYK